jgi:hypothetical protein
VKQLALTRWLPFSFVRRELRHDEGLHGAFGNWNAWDEERDFHFVTFQSE